MAERTEVVLTELGKRQKLLKIKRKKNLKSSCVLNESKDYELYKNILKRKCISKIKYPYIDKHTQS